MNGMSDNINELVEALTQAQADITGVERNREVTVKPKKKGDYQPPSYKFKYATLDNIIYHLREPLTKNGLWFTQRVDGGQMVTRIVHKSGQWLDAGVPMPNVSGTPQEIGAIISYFKRYSLSAAFAIVTEEDDDSGSTVDAEDRSVSFYSRGASRPPQDDHRDVVTGIEEPDDGWSAWSLDLAKKVDVARSDAELDKLRDSNKRFINGVAKVDPMIYDSLMRAFTTRRQAVKPNESF